MSPRAFLVAMGLAALAGLVVAVARQEAAAGEAGVTSGDYKVLEPIRHGNLTVFPVVAARSYDTSEFLTLDEGLRTGEVVVTESGKVRGLIRRSPPGGVVTPWHDGAQVNQLVLVNNAKRPLLLLAGEIVTGGKQDRVIAQDRIVPAESDPIDLGVFCVEPGRWVASSQNFGGMSFAMASPALRGRAMADKDQAKVWAEVQRTREQMALDSSSAVNGAPPMAARELEATTSYAQVIENETVKNSLDSVAKPVERSYASIISQLRDQHAVGVVVAVSGQIVWADLFASTSLLEKYWPKLVRSYATEAVVTRAKGTQPNQQMAQQFLERTQGRHETVDSEPGLYRHTEVSGDGFKVFELTSLLPKTGFAVHIAKMAE